MAFFDADPGCGGAVGALEKARIDHVVFPGKDPPPKGFPDWVPKNIHVEYYIVVSEADLPQAHKAIREAKHGSPQSVFIPG
jgi:hypothetical protein